MGEDGERATHRGIHWYRDRQGNVSFYDESGSQWVRWERGKGAPPLPPKWQVLGVPTRITRPGWRSRWRIIPLILVVAAVAVAILQVVLPPGNNAAKEAQASAALLGKCLAKNANKGFSSKPVACSSTKAAVRVVQVLPSTPGSPLCPSGTTGVELAYPGVRYLHIECVQAVRPSG